MDNEQREKETTEYLEQRSRNQAEKRTHAEAQRRREKTRIDSEAYGLISLRLCASARENKRK
jgi:hypothetical protein